MQWILVTIAALLALWYLGSKVYQLFMTRQGTCQSSTCSGCATGSTIPAKKISGPI